MSRRLPDQGARWGADPSPTIPSVSTPQDVPPLYVELCSLYGEQNVARASSIRENLRNNYPHLAILNIDPLEFADDLLDSAARSMEIAAADERPHSLPETLDLIDKFIGSTLAQNPTFTSTRNCTVSYGDESRGKAARAQAKRVMLIKTGVIICGCTVAYSFGAGIGEHPGWGMAASFFTFLLLGGFLFG